MRPYVTDVGFNIQGGGNYHLGPKTLIVGPNRVGKSSIIRAIELATTGRASDVAGRDTLALDAELFALAPGDYEFADSAAAFSDGTDAGWRLDRGKRAKRAGTTATFPLRDVTAAILGSAETARKFFLSVAGRLSWDGVIAEFPTQLQASLVPYKSSDGAAGLLAAIEGTKKRARELSAEAKAIRANAAALVHGLPPPSTPAEIEAAKLAEEHAARVSQLAGAGARLAALMQEAGRAEARIRDCQSALEASRAALAEIPQSEPLHPVIEHAIVVGEFLAAAKSGICAICGTTVGIGMLIDRTTRAKNRVAAALQIQTDRHNAEVAVREGVIDLQIATEDLERIQEEIPFLQGLIGDGAENSISSFGDYATLIAIAERWKTIRDSEGRAIEKEMEAQRFGQLADTCSTVMERLLERRRAEFEQRVQTYLPSSFVFGIDLKDGSRDVLRIGLRGAKGQLRTGLSGAEWATVTAAISGAVAEGIDPAIPVIIVPEDRDFDSATLADVMESFTRVDAQVILCSTKLPTRKIEGWNVISPGTGDVPWCNECRAWVALGPCDHGLGKRDRIVVGG